MIAATRSRCGGLAFMVALLCAIAAAPAWGSVPGGYGAQALDPPGPASGTLTGARAGDRVLNAGDVDADRRNDVLVAAPAAPISGTITGRVYMFSGATGELIWQAAAPSPQAADVPGSEPTGFGTAIARLGDIGVCNFGGASCTLSTQRDGAAEVLVSAPGTDIDPDAGKDEGVVYVLDGATGRTLKDIRVSAGERPQFGSGGFGKAVASLSGQPPCAGFAGIGSCLVPPGSDVAVGDLDGGGAPDFVVGAPDYTELGPNFGGEYAGCTGAVDSCPGVGRVYVIRGEQISGSSQTPLSLTTDNSSLVQFPGDAGGGDPPRFGSTLTPAGDLGRCAEGNPAGPTCLRSPAPLTNVPDGRPDFVASAPGADVGATSDAGAAFVVDAAGVAAMLEIDAPSVQQGAAFGSFAQSFAAPGRLNGDGTPDLVIGAPAHDGQGAAHFFNGDLLGADRLIRTFTDPAPVAGGSFGAPLATLGDISGDGQGEVALGAAAGARVGAVHLVSACARDIFQTVKDPDPQSGGAFGAAIAPLGDLNGDGMLDLVVGVPGFDADPITDRGRAYILTSDGSTGPGLAGCAGVATDDGSGGGDEEFFQPGDEDTVVIARVLRRLVLKANHKRVRKFASIRLRGRLTASANRSVCQKRQKIALQRRRSSGGRFQTFDVALTRASGKFTARAIAERTFVYRARVSKTARCMGAVSKTAKVAILRRSGTR